MIRQSATKVVNINRELAEEFATMPAWKGERPLRQERVEMLTGKINDGLFHSPTWAVAKLNGQTYRMNGQHSSVALASCEKLPTSLNASILEFEVDSEQELANLFGQFDTPESVRRMREVINAHAAVDDILDSCPINTLQIILSGIAQTDSQLQSTGSSHQRAALMHSHRPFIEFAKKYGKRKHVMYMAVIAAMYLTWKSDKQHADLFWNLVASEEHPDSNNPTRVLARFLTGEIVGRTRRMGMRWDRRAVMVKCIHAWNAYWRGQTTALKYTPDAPIPNVL